jgi:hypothetical protein
MLVVDLMHEFEQGVWKNLFTHLVRILYASNPALVIEMDRRYVFYMSNLYHVNCCNIFQVPPGSQIRRCHPKILSKFL